MTTTSNYLLSVENPETGQTEAMRYTYPGDAVRYARMVKEIRPHWKITLTGPDGEEIDWTDATIDWEQEP